MALVDPMLLDKRQIFLVLVSSSHVRERNIELIHELSALDYHTLVVTLNIPYSILARLYSENGVDLEKVSYIDAVTRNSMGSAENVPGVVRYINNPANITDLGIAVTDVLKELSGKKVCILYDSISTMLIYLPSSNISKFIHFVANKLRLMNIGGIFLAVEKGLDPMLMNQVTTFVDTVIDTE